MIIYTEYPKEFTKQTSKQVNLAGVYYIKLTFKKYIITYYQQTVGK